MPRWVLSAGAFYLPASSSRRASRRAANRLGRPQSTRAPALAAYLTPRSRASAYSSGPPPRRSQMGYATAESYLATTSSVDRLPTPPLTTAAAQIFSPLPEAYLACEPSAPPAVCRVCLAFVSSRPAFSCFFSLLHPRSSAVDLR